MSYFYCPIARVTAIRPLGDLLSVAIVDGLTIIVPRAEWRVGDLGVVIPDGALLPDDLAASLRGRAKLFGERRTRVRTFKLRGEISDGLLLGPLPGGKEGEDVSRLLGITKYKPVAPSHMRGDCELVAGLTIPYDVESFKRHRRVLLAGEAVEMTEKIHGTMCGITIVPGLGNPQFIGGDTLVYSKGLAAQQLCFTETAENRHNLYLRTIKRLELRERIISIFGYTNVTVFGEIFGGGVQDLSYALREPTFSAFDVWIGSPKNGHFIDKETLSLYEELPRAPLLYRGSFDVETMIAMASGDTIAGAGSHIREGVIVTPMRERRHPRIGRVILKYVSPEYLTRQRGTEYE